MNKTPQKIAFLVMRLQPQQKGHTDLIYKALLENDLVIVLLGSSQEKGTKRNPFSTADKISFLKQTFGVSSKLKIIAIRDIGASTKEEWTNHVFNTIEKAGLKQPSRYYSGDDLNAMFYEDCINPYIKEKIEVIKVDRLETKIMSGTEIRNAINNGCESWKKHVPECLIGLIEEKYPKGLINKYVENGKLK